MKDTGPAVTEVLRPVERGGRITNMRAKRPKWKRHLIWLGAALGGSLVVCLVLLAKPRSRHIESFITRFESCRSQANAEQLVYLIENRAVTQEQARRIIRLLFYPNVTTRKAYPLGRRPTISVELPFPLRFRHAMVACEEYVWTNGQNQYGGSSGGANSYNTAARLLQFHPTPEAPGRYKMEIRYKYAPTVQRRKRRWVWRPSLKRFPRSLLPFSQTRLLAPDPNAGPTYECEFTVPVDVNVVQKEKAEKLALVSGPEVDRTMRGAFTCRPYSMSSSSHRVGSRRMTHTDTIEISYRNLPAAAVFQYVLELPDGRHIAQMREYDQPRYLRANSSGSFYIPTLDFALTEPGPYQGNIVLRADPNEAYRDPAIKSLWNGRLEFPITFSVEIE